MIERKKAMHEFRLLVVIEGPLKFRENSDSASRLLGICCSACRLQFIRPIVLARPESAVASIQYCSLRVEKCQPLRAIGAEVGGKI